MIKIKYILTLCAVIIISLLFTRCKKNRNDDNALQTSFDKTGMLRNIGENIIVPAYADLKISVDSLQYFNNLFVAGPSLSNLADVQRIFLTAYSRYQWVSAFEFGPADNELIRANFNTFPCDTVQIKSKIAAADYNFSTVADLDAKGFPAADFLLYGSKHDNDEVLLTFTTGVDAANRKNYLAALISELKSKTDIVNAAWSPSGGNYLNTFINNTGVNVGSSLGLLVNQLNFDLEILKNFKIGIPLGKKSLGVTYPGKTEAYYSQVSVMLAVEHIMAIQRIYLGKSRQGSDGLGLDDYLAHIMAQYNGGMLSDAITVQLAGAISKLQAVPDPLSQTITNSPSVADAPYLELQKLVVLFKTDMPSALGVLITYQDNDGD